MGNSDQLAIELATSLSTLTSASSSLSEASSSISSAASSFNSVVQKIELRFKDLAIWEQSLNERKTMLDEVNAALDQREEKLKKEEEEVMKKKSELKEQQMEWESRQAKMNANVDSVAEVVTLDVGGKKFRIRKELLLQHKHSYFTTLFQGDHENKEEFFIDKDPKHFATVANYLRDNAITKRIKPKDINDLRDTFAYYNIPLPQFDISERQPEGSHSTIFDPAGDLLANEWKVVVRSWLPRSHFHLLYKGTKNGFSPDAFHELCDSRGPLFTLIMSTEGFLFGGYTLTTISHDSSSSSERHALHSDSFLFTLTNPRADPPTTFPLLPGLWPTRYTPFEHIHLGWGIWGYDMALSKTPHLDKMSYIGFPYAFKDKTGHAKKTFTGSEYFTVREVEVFSVVPLYSKSSNHQILE